MAEHELIDDDYIAVDGALWVTVKNASIRIRDTGEGLSIVVYRLTKEDQTSITETWATWEEFEPEEEDEDADAAD